MLKSRDIAPSHPFIAETPNGSVSAMKSNGQQRLDKRQIEQRIEEDRERHKRAREGIWAIPQSGTELAEDAEFDKMWEETGDVNEDDIQQAKEEAEERRRCMEYEEA